MFQNALARLGGIANKQAPVVICNNDHRFMVAEQLHEIDVLSLNIVLESVGRNKRQLLQSKHYRQPHQVMPYYCWQLQSAMS